MKIEIDKPVVPQFIADWLEILLDRKGSKYEIFSLVFGVGTVFEAPIYEWLVENKDTFILAVMYGYEVQVESLYYAKIKGSELIGDRHETMYWMFDKQNNSLYVSDTYRFNFNIDSDYIHDTSFTIEEWNKLGINDTNADFEKVD